MAQMVTRTFVDDIDGSEAERTFTFAVDGVSYDIDLSSANIAEFKSAIGGFIESARKVGKASTSKRGPAAHPGVSSREQTRAVREWARQNGHTLSDRGRIPTEVLTAFNAAHDKAATG
jgi:hypothetical protein